MTDLPVLEWEASEYGGFEAKLGVVLLRVELEPLGWQVHWDDDFAQGHAQSVEQAKAKARAFAKTLLRQVLAQLDRQHNPETGLIEQVPDAGVQGD